MNKIFAILIALVLFAMPAFAGGAQVIKLGTGGETGNYFSMGNDINNYCSKSLVDGSLEVLTSGASVANLLGMKNKEFTAGIAQEDVLRYYAKRDPGINPNSIKIIAPLHKEVLYLLIPRNYTPAKSGSFWDKALTMIGKGDEAVQLSLESLEGDDLAAQGGAAVSAEALKAFTGVQFNVVDVTGQAIPSGMPVLMVGGQPYKPVAEMLASGKYVMVSLDADAIVARTPFYLKTTINYNAGGKAYTATTVAVRALLLGKSFRSEERNVNMVKLAACIDKNLSDLADDGSTNPNWQSVADMVDEPQTNWAYFPLK